MDSVQKQHVFISYVQENRKEVDRLCGALEQEGIKVWLDRNDINPGTFWEDAIRKAIQSGAFFIACFSREYNERTSTYMNEELNLAIEYLRKHHRDKIWFIPVKFSGEIPDWEIMPGKTLRNIQWIRLDEDWELAINRLVDLIKQKEDTSYFDLPKNYLEKEYTYRGLKSLIESGNGAGFHNADLGHPVYYVGANEESEEMLKVVEYADSPQKNALLKMLSKLSEELKALNPDISTFIWWYDFTEWKDFCKFALDVYNDRRNL